MRLHLGYQNLITYNGESHTDSYSMTDLGTSSDIGTTIAPDGSSLAEGKGVTASAGAWGGWTTRSRTDIPVGDYMYMWGVYYKPSSDHSIRTVLIVDSGTLGTDDFGFNISFINSEIDLAIDNPWGSSDDSYDYGVVTHEDDWYYMYMVVDARNKPSYNPTFRFYINSPQDHSIAGEGGYAWGYTLEASEIRGFAGPSLKTTSSTIDHTDFLAIDFTQLPTNIGEVEEDLYNSMSNLSGTVVRGKTHNDRNVKTMEWKKINYVKHGRMIYGIREGLRDKIGQDCVLFYPEGFKSDIHWAVIRIVDFRFEYTDIPNIASVEVDYHIISTNRY